MGWKYGRLENGRPFRKWVDEGDEKPPHTLAGVTFTKKREDTTPMSNLSVADEVASIMKKLTDHGVPFDQAATVAHRTEVAYKNGTIRKNDVDPCDDERNAKLAWIDAESKRLHKLGGLSANEALDAAQRNWAAQNNSPGQR
jgi:hypothetical protein